MKGMELPINIVVVIALAVLVLMVAAVFFITQTSGTMNEADATRYFDQGCVGLCSLSSNQNFIIAYNLEKETPDFYKACTALYSDARGFPNRCMEKCGCDITATSVDVEQELAGLRNEFGK